MYTVDQPVVHPGFHLVGGGGKLPPQNIQLPERERKKKKREEREGGREDGGT